MALLTLKFAADVRNPSYAVVEFHGELDQSTRLAAETQMNEFLVSFKRPHLIFDLAELKYVNSEGIGFMMKTHASLVKNGQHLSLAGLQPNVADVFNVIGVPKIIPVFPNAKAAIDHKIPWNL